MGNLQDKDPRVFWTIVGICFGIIVLAWLPLAFQKISSIFEALQQTSHVTSDRTQELWHLKDALQGNTSSTESSAAYLQVLTEQMKEILTSTSSSSTESYK